MSAPDPRLVLLALALVASGCATTSAPSDWLPSPAEARRSTTGGWIEVRTLSRRVEGELIAVGADSLYVLPLGGSLEAVATNAVSQARLAHATNAAGRTAAWGLAGTASTLSHGILLVVSAPVWLITTGVTTYSESGAHRMAYPRHGWGEMARYARFPQGLPAGLDRQTLHPPPYLP